MKTKIINFRREITITKKGDSCFESIKNKYAKRNIFKYKANNIIDALKSYENNKQDLIMIDLDSLPQSFYFMIAEIIKMELSIKFNVSHQNLYFLEINKKDEYVEFSRIKLDKLKPKKVLLIKEYNSVLEFLNLLVLDTKLNNRMPVSA